MLDVFIENVAFGSVPIDFTLKPIWNAFVIRIFRLVIENCGSFMKCQAFESVWRGFLMQFS